jgi:flavin-dependent dehydrogenase
MKNIGTEQARIELGDGSNVAIIGGGPAGAFFALHLLRKAAKLSRKLRVVVFERRRLCSLKERPCEEWKGCNYCAGGISPKLYDLLAELGLQVPEPIIQSRIRSLTIQGFWKNIELEVPAGRTMLAVYRGSRPDKRLEGRKNFDSFLLDEALKAGAGLISGEVSDVTYGANAKPLLRYRVAGRECQMEADLAVFAAGVNEEMGVDPDRSRMLQSLRCLLPRFRPARVRKALIFELEAEPNVPTSLLGNIHFVEYGSKALPLEMCSLIPKRSYVTVVLVGASVDRAVTHGESQRVAEQFLKLPHIQKLVSPGTRFSPVCLCRPNMVIGSAEHPFGNRVAAVGDIVTARLYKDGILSAQQMARKLAETALTRGIDTRSLEEGYGPVLKKFRRDNRLASFVFLLHRVFFSSSVLSRVLYQAVITERKTTPSGRRQLERILWRIASGDDDYREIFFSMLHPATLYSIVTGGILITMRNYLAELCFGLRWEGFGRFTTGVAVERLEEKRRQFSRLMKEASVDVPGALEFERMYTIKIAAPRQKVLEQLGRFGEVDRGYFRPRWVTIQRVAGVPNTPGCVIRYEIGTPLFCFSLVLEQLAGGHMAVYRVRDGFARGGILVFEIETLSAEISALSIYVAFNFPRGEVRVSRPFWWLFRLLFPAFLHDVLWNHSLCELKSIAESLPDTRAVEPGSEHLHIFGARQSFQ